MLVETYQWVVNGGQLKDAFHYFSMVDVDGRPLLYKDIAAFAQELSTLGHQQAQWIQPWSETGGSVVYEHIPKVSAIRAFAYVRRGTPLRTVKRIPFLVNLSCPPTTPRMTIVTMSV